MNAIRVALSVLLCWFSVLCGAQAEWVYDARIAWINAGRAVVKLDWQPPDYELTGTVKTSRLLQPFFTWSGRFIARGIIDGSQPASHLYFLETRARGKHTILSLYRDEVMLYDDRKGWRSFAAPPGVDALSALFIARNCYRGEFLHDGEDPYPVAVVEREEVNLSQAPRYFNGAALRCLYRARDLRGRDRDVTVWSALVSQRPLAVKLRVSIPRAPDGYLLLRVD